MQVKNCYESSKLSLPLTPTDLSFLTEIFDDVVAIGFITCAIGHVVAQHLKMGVYRIGLMSDTEPVVRVLPLPSLGIVSGISRLVLGQIDRAPDTPQPRLIQKRPIRLVRGHSHPTAAPMQAPAPIACNFLPAPSGH
jgi:hypothetical protein